MIIVIVIVIVLALIVCILMMIAILRESGRGRRLPGVRVAAAPVGANQS